MPHCCRWTTIVNASKCERCFLYQCDDVNWINYGNYCILMKNGGIELWANACYCGLLDSYRSPFLTLASARAANKLACKQKTQTKMIIELEKYSPSFWLMMFARIDKSGGVKNSNIGDKRTSQLCNSNWHRKSWTRKRSSAFIAVLIVRFSFLSFNDSLISRRVSIFSSLFRPSPAFQWSYLFSFVVRFTMKISVQPQRTQRIAFSVRKFAAASKIITDSHALKVHFVRSSFVRSVRSSSTFRQFVRFLSSAAMSAFQLFPFVVHSNRMRREEEKKKGNRKNKLAKPTTKC